MSTSSTYEPILSEAELASAFNYLADKKAASSWGKLVSGGVLAGAMISLAAYIYLIVKSTHGSPVLAGLCFCAGLVMVVLLQVELFTSNVLLAIPALGGRIGWGRVLRNWSLVYTANLLGCLFFVWLLLNAGVSEALHEAAHKVFEAKTTRTLGAYLARGFLCNVLVVMAYQMALGARDIAGKILALLFPVMLFVACGFEHCVANMFLIPFGAALEGLTFGETVSILLHNLVPVTVANILGGVAVLMIQPRFQAMVFSRKRSAGTK